jgi:hypothetical protein
VDKPLPDKNLFRKVTLGVDWIPRVGDMLYGNDAFYSSIATITGFRDDPLYLFGCLICNDSAINGLGCSAENLKGFRWYRPGKKTIVILNK